MEVYLTNRTRVLHLIIISITIGVIYGCAGSHGKISSSSGPTIHAILLDAMTTKEPQPFLKGVSWMPSNNSMGSQIALAGLRENEVWLIVTLKITSSEEGKLRNMSDVVFIGLSGTSAPGYLEEGVFSRLDPSRDKYDVVWNSLNSESTINSGTTQLKVAFQVLEESLSQGMIKFLDAAPIPIGGFLVR